MILLIRQPCQRSSCSLPVLLPCVRHTRERHRKPAGVCPRLRLRLRIQGAERAAAPLHGGAEQKLLPAWLSLGRGLPPAHRAALGPADFVRRHRALARPRQCRWLAAPVRLTAHTCCCGVAPASNTQRACVAHRRRRKWQQRAGPCTAVRVCTKMICAVQRAGAGRGGALAGARRVCRSAPRCGEPADDLHASHGRRASRANRAAGRTERPPFHSARRLVRALARLPSAVVAPPLCVVPLDGQDAGRPASGELQVCTAPLLQAEKAVQHEAMDGAMLAVQSGRALAGGGAEISTSGRS